MHLDDNAMAAYLEGHMPPAEQSGVRAHLDECAECRAIVVGAVQRRGARGSIAGADTLAVGSDPRSERASSRRIFEAGAQIGPYLVDRLLGVGGMGYVYAARDPRLDRVVALKLIRHTPGLPAAQLAERLKRESKALARLSHPNVTAVYELGSAGDEVYIAIEYVAGTTLRAWLDGAKRDVGEVLATFVGAGRGLAAAHAAGLVHRDFKPDNVLLGAGGVVKVTDFGLATIGTDVFARDSATADAPATLTRTGALLGTPAYMAPEQFDAAAGERAPVDARADQFAFCVALYEALVGRRPFAGATLHALAAAVYAGVDIPRTPRISPRVRRVLARGLAVSPDARFASMDALLDALAPSRRRGVMLGIAGATVAAWGVVGALLLGSSAPPAVCQGAAAEVATVWHPARRQAAARAFAATNAPDAAASWAAVDARIGAYLDAWAKMHGEACQATHVHRQQSEAALDLRMACLERRRAEIDALLGVFERADADVVIHAREAAAKIPALAACTDVEALARRNPPPSEPAARAHYDRIRARLDAARALFDVARYDEAMAIADAIVADRALAASPAIAAEAQHVRGKIFTARGAHADAEAAIHHALVGAQTARADDLVAVAAIDLAYIIGQDKRRAVDAMRWVDLAGAAIVAKGGDDLLGARLDTIRADILVAAGKLAEAEVAARAAVATAARRAPGSPLEAETLDSLGIVLGLLGKLDEALPTLERAVAGTEAVYGPTHSLTASVRMNLANALAGVRRYDESNAQYERVVAIREALFGKDNVQVAVVLSNFGQTLQEQGKLARARPLLERALAIRVAQLGADSPAVAKTAANLGYLLLDERAYAAAAAQFTRVGAILEGKLGPAHPARADDLAGLGLAYIGLGVAAKAVAPLERAAALAAGGDPVNAASIEAALARALFARKRDRARAVKLARAARGVLAEAGEADAVAEIDAWLPTR